MIPKITFGNTKMQSERCRSYRTIALHIEQGARGLDNPLPGLHQYFESSTGSDL